MLTRIIVALVLAPFFVAALTVLPQAVLVIMVAGILAIAAFELLRAVGVTKVQWCLYLVTMISAAAVPIFSLKINAISRFVLFLRIPQCNPDALKPFAAQTPPSIYFISQVLSSRLLPF